MSYEIVDVDALGRIGKFVLGNKQLITPNLFPVVHPTKNIITPSELKEFGANCIFTNSYIIYQNDNIREEVLKKGIHQFLDFEGLIATDSGAFQQYMYKDSKISIDAKEIEKFQEDIGSDFPVILDIPVQLDDDYEKAQKKVNITLERAKENIKRRTNKNCIWFGPIHGAKFDELLKLSTIEMNKLDFGVYAIGGLVKAFIDYRFDLVIKILLNVKQYIVPSKPLHMFGLGLPQFFSLAVACGCDLMDSAAYLLYAKENRYFTLSTGTKKLEDLVEFPCHCPVCSKYSPEELKKMEDSLRIQLLARHNLYLSFSELRTIRQAIREGNLWELVEQRIRSHPNLVKAFNILDQFKPLFDKHEKLFKKSGRLFASPESIKRPLFHRYENRLLNYYRVPKDVKYLIILPELDIKGKKSPSINEWLEIINDNKIIPRKYLHIVFFSRYFGIIPIELVESFPMGQCESIPFLEDSDKFSQNSLQYTYKYINSNIECYKKCIILMPEKYINQFNEKVKFPIQDIINDLNITLKPLLKDKISVYKSIEEALQFFLNK